LCDFSTRDVGFSSQSVRIFITVSLVAAVGVIFQPLNRTGLLLTGLKKWKWEFDFFFKAKQLVSKSINSLCGDNHSNLA
jgi:hypothetical protein